MVITFFFQSYIKNIIKLSIKNYIKNMNNLFQISMCLLHQITSPLIILLDFKFNSSQMFKRYLSNLEE